MVKYLLKVNSLDSRINVFGVDSEQVFAHWTNPVAFYMLKVNNGNSRTRCEICSKLIIKTPKRRHWRHSGVFIVNFEHLLHLVLLFLLLTLNM